MNEIVLDCIGITDSKMLHCALQEKLSLPDWYGHNLDALFDCLCEFGGHLVLQNWSRLGNWREGFALTLADASAENPDFTFTLA